MRTGLESLDDESLAALVRQCKKGVLDALSAPLDAPIPKGGISPLAFAANVSVPMLRSLESEVWRRGLDPRESRFGKDVLALIDNAQ